MDMEDNGGKDIEDKCAECTPTKKANKPGCYAVQSTPLPTTHTTSGLSLHDAILSLLKRSRLKVQEEMITIVGELAEFWLAFQAMDTRVDTFVNKPTDADINPLLAQLSILKQTRSHNNLVLSYKTQNRRSKSFVHVPVAAFEEYFNKSSTWVNMAININCGNGVKPSSAKGIAKYCSQRHNLVFKEAMNDMKVSVTNKMSTVAIAAMFKSTNITSWIN
jgi:hypothetical protein